MATDRRTSIRASQLKNFSVTGYDIKNASVSGSEKLIDNSVPESKLTIINDPVDGYYLKYTTASGLEWSEAGGVSDHGGLTGLSDDDHTQYILHVHGTGTTNLVGGSGAGSSLDAASVGNVILGANAGDGITTADYSVAIGYESMATGSTTGDYNVAIGYQTGYQLTSGYQNVLIGPRLSGDSISTGYNNVIIGYYNHAGAPYGSDSRSVNHVVSIGSGAGLKNTANSVVFIGANAGQQSTGGNGSIYIGKDAGRLNTGQANNTVIGNEAGEGASGTNYYACLLLGYRAGWSLAAGSSHNTYLGYQSGYSTTTAVRNFAMGYQSLYQNQTGNDNIMFGYQSGRGTSSNSYSSNVAVGNYTLSSLTTGSNNVAVGHQAGNGLTSGGNNVLIGKQAGDTLTTESNKLYIANATGTPLIYGEFDNNLLKIDGDILPSTSGTYDLGSSALPWAEGHFDNLYVAGSPVPDYVFDKFFDGEVKSGDKDIEIMPLEEVIEYIETERHLPTLLSRKESKENKQSVGELITRLTETVEIQMLYIKELEQRIAKLESGD